eukprot:gene1936-1401_t
MDDGDGDDFDRDVEVNFRNPSSLITHSAMDESLESDVATGNDPSAGGQFSSIRNDYPFPISRPPAKHRDWMYGIAFVAHFIAVVVISLVEEGSLHHASESYERAGSWASVVMITTLLGSTFGGLVAILLASNDDSRTLILQFALIFSCIVKFLLGNIMFIMRSPYSFLGVFMLFFAMWDLVLYPTTKKSLSFSSTLIHMVADVTRRYGIWLGLSSIIVIAIQTLILLWWGAFCIGAISTTDPASVIPVLAVLLFSWYWMTEFCRVLLSFLVGGSILWLFVRDEQDPSSSSQHHGTDSGKAIRYLFFKHHPQLPVLCKCIGNTCDRYGGCGNVWYEMARPFHALSLSLLAVYGRTLKRTSQDLLTYYPETMNASLAETTRFTITATASCIAGLLAIAFGLFAEGGDRDTWPIFVLIAYLVAYAGAVLAGTVYICAVDALIVASVLNPARVAQSNQIVLLRFLRTAEVEQ